MLNDYKFPVRVAYDAKELRPGCAIIQAAMGCPTAISAEFPTGTWLTSPTDNMRVYELETEDQLQKLVRITKLTHKEAIT